MTVTHYTLQYVNTVLELVLQFCSIQLLWFKGVSIKNERFSWQYMLTSLLKQYITKKINLRLYK